MKHFQALTQLYFGSAHQIVTMLMASPQSRQSIKTHTFSTKSVAILKPDLCNPLLSIEDAPQTLSLNLIKVLQFDNPVVRQYKSVLCTEVSTHTEHLSIATCQPCTLFSGLGLKLNQESLLTDVPLS